MHSCRDRGLCWPETYFEVTVMQPLPVFSHTEGWFETERVISFEKSPVVNPPPGKCNAGYTSCSNCFWTSRGDFLQRWKAVNQCSFKWTHICICHRHSNMTVYCSEIHAYTHTHTHTLHSKLFSCIMFWSVFFFLCPFWSFFQQTV